MNEPKGRTLPPFPVDDFTLDQLWHALNTSVGFGDDGERRCVGGDFTLNQFLDFMSGHDPERQTLVGYSDGLLGEGDPGGIPIYTAWDQHYSREDVIRALLAEVRRLRTGEEQL